ncbi:MAG: hypothetical protein HYV26_07065 [Candidatus Hydrogenedentes bacterium]|nr:hypothetical protein [Candidatus Hydrogenedentota bacterium]
MSQASEITQPLAEDLHFVRHAIERSGFDNAEFTVACVWAVVNLVGLSLYDFSLLAGAFSG